MTLALHWNPKAREDRAEIMDYIAQDNPAAALDLDELIEQKAETLLANPTIGRIGRVKGTRELVAHPNYILIYRIVGEAVEVLRVKHAAQKWP